MLTTPTESVFSSCAPQSARALVAERGPWSALHPLCSSSEESINEHCTPLPHSLALAFSRLLRLSPSSAFSSFSFRQAIMSTLLLLPSLLSAKPRRCRLLTRFLESNEEKLKTLPVPQIAKKYYEVSSSSRFPCYRRPHSPPPTLCRILYLTAAGDSVSSAQHHLACVVSATQQHPCSRPLKTPAHSLSWLRILAFSPDFPLRSPTLFSNSVLQLRALRRPRTCICSTRSTPARARSQRARGDRGWRVCTTCSVAFATTSTSTAAPSTASSRLASQVCAR